VSGFRQFLLSILPDPLLSKLKPWWRRFFGLKVRARGWIPFALWLVLHTIWHGKRAVIVCRCGGIGDVLCTLPICAEVRRRHPRKLLVFITAPIWREVVVMSQLADLVYANKWWIYPFTFPMNVRFFGLIDAIYNARTSGERLSQTSGMACHLVDDFAASCGITLAGPLPKLSPTPHLIEKTLAAHRLDRKITHDRLLIGINPGPNWPVKQWAASNWQKLINRIHSEYDAIIIQFGITRPEGPSEYDNLTGVTSLAGRLNGEELVALIAACKIVVSIDSGPVHIAGAVGTPIVGLFGPLDPRLVLPQQSAAIGLFADVPCLFCHNRTPVMHWITGCPNDIACMKKLDEQIVFETVKSMLTPDSRREVKEPLTLFD
jgi:ADP-heptose:LPS heptosyltransferase